MKSNAKPFVIKPYAAELTGWRRAVSWAAIPVISFLCLIIGFFYALTTPYLIPQFAAPLVLVGLCVVWALPEAHKAPVGLLRALFFSFLVAMLLWPNYLALAPPGLPWITAIRLIGFPLVFILLICVSVSAEFRSRTKAAMKAVPWLTPLFVGFLALQVVSVAFSKSPGDSINQLVVAEVSWTAMFFASCYIFQRPGTATRWIYILWFAAIVSSIIGLWEARLEHVPWAGHIPSFLQVDPEYAEKVLKGARRLGSDKYRVQGTHSTSLGLAEILALTSPFLIHYMVAPYHRFIRIAAALSIPPVFLTILATDARLGSVGFLLAMLCYGVSWAFTQWRTVKTSIFGPALLFGAPVGAVIFTLATLFIGRLHLIFWGGGQDKYSSQGRSDQVAQGLPKVFSHPWGHGIGQGAETLDYHNLEGVLTIDTYWLLIALEYGVIGFLLYYGTFLTAIIFGAKVSHFEDMKEQEHTLLIPASISLTIYFIIKSIFSQTENHSVAFMMLGMVAALILRVREANAVDKADGAAKPVLNAKAA